jgi:hypothetical protein
MATIHLHQTTTATPGQFVAGLTDFGPGRKELFPNSADGYLKVHDQGANWADVTEGSNGIWERLRYDWSNPGRITMTTTDSNTWGGRSGHTYTLTSRPDGTTDVDVVVVREGKNLKGRLIEVLVGVGGKRVLGKALASTAKAIEARNYPSLSGPVLAGGRHSTVTRTSAGCLPGVRGRSRGAARRRTRTRAGTGRAATGGRCAGRRVRRGCRRGPGSGAV